MSHKIFGCSEIFWTLFFLTPNNFLIGPYWLELQGKDEDRPVLVVGQVYRGPYWALFQEKEVGRPVLVKDRSTNFLIGHCWVEFLCKDEGRPVLWAGQINKGPHLLPHFPLFYLVWLGSAPFTVLRVF